MRHPAAALALALLTAAALSAQEDPPVRPYDDAVKALTEAVREAAPERVRVEVEETTVEALGWRASRERCPARVVTIMAPSGAARAFGLLPRAGTYTPVPGGPARCVTLGPDLVIVGAPHRPEAALTLEHVEAARPLLDAASAPILSLEEWPQPDPRPELDVSGFTRGRVRVDEHPHYVSLDVAAGGSVDLEGAWRAGHRALVWRVHAEDGGFVPPTISIAPR